jgi:HJR/Mrr/RecB family endonuclease
MSEITQPQEPKPEDFGLSTVRIKRFRSVFEDDPISIATFGIPLIAAAIIGANTLLPHSLVGFMSPLWRMLLPVIPVVYFIGAIQRCRKAIAAKRPDYPKFVCFQSAMQTYSKLMKTYSYLRRQARYGEVRKKRRQESFLRENSNAKWTHIDGREFEIEVVTILFSKGYDVEHTGGSRMGDEGIDFVVRLNGKRIIGQCKAHKSYLSAGFVRELYGTLLHEKADEAWLVCTTGFYSGAKSFAYGKPIRLLTIESVQRLPEEHRTIGDEERCSTGKNGPQCNP